MASDIPRRVRQWREAGEKWRRDEPASAIPEEYFTALLLIEHHPGLKQTAAPESVTSSEKDRRRRRELADKFLKAAVLDKEFARKFEKELFDFAQDFQVDRGRGH